MQSWVVTKVDFNTLRVGRVGSVGGNCFRAGNSSHIQRAHADNKVSGVAVLHTDRAKARFTTVLAIEITVGAHHVTGAGARGGAVARGSTYTACAATRARRVAYTLIAGAATG
ncbi:hypothetical protein Ndes2526B_g01242 [Nannochloris sp. 'desiccata']